MGKRALMSENSPEPLLRSLGGALRKGQLMREMGMMLRRAGLGLLVGAVLMASSGASAGPALVFEPYNGTVFYAEDPDAQWFPASLTKLMTAYVAFQALKAGTVTPDTKLICSKEATEQAPSKLWLKVGESITLDVALKVLIVESANDVAVMIAEGVAGSQEAFVQRMNETAQHLGMTRTNFANVNGLPDEHLEAADRPAPGARGRAQQLRVRRVVDEIVDETARRPGQRCVVIEFAGFLSERHGLVATDQLTLQEK